MNTGAASPPEEPVFAEPWQAQAFALALLLHRRGLYTWREWTEALADEIAAASSRAGAGGAEAYYAHWLAALERLVARKGAASADELERYRRAWDHAAERTPHGRPIELRPEDFDGAAG